MGWGSSIFSGAPTDGKSTSHPLFQPFQVLMAWAVGVLEVLGLIVFVGYSITYTLHVAHKHLCFALVFFFALEKWVWNKKKSLWVWEEWWWKFVLQGMMRP